MQSEKKGIAGFILLVVIFANFVNFSVNLRKLIHTKLATILDVRK